MLWRHSAHSWSSFHSLCFSVQSSKHVLFDAVKERKGDACHARCKWLVDAECSQHAPLAHLRSRLSGILPTCIHTSNSTHSISLLPTCPTGTCHPIPHATSWPVCCTAGSTVQGTIGPGEAGCWRQGAALHSYHYRQVLLYKVLLDQGRLAAKDRWLHCTVTTIDRFYCVCFCLQVRLVVWRVPWLLAFLQVFPHLHQSSPQQHWCILPHLISIRRLMCVVM